LGNGDRIFTTVEDFFADIRGEIKQGNAHGQDSLASLQKHPPRGHRQAPVIANTGAQATRVRNPISPAARGL
jgi:hypothetical protein